MGGDATAANQTVILNRLGAWTGSGANTILGGIRALASKDAPAPSDIGGTFDPSTDSVEAIRERGDDAWKTGGAGTGSSVVTLTYNDADANAVSNLKITCMDSTGTNLIATATTDSDGQVVFNLDDDDYHFLSPTTVNYAASDNTLTVSGNTSQTYTLTARSIPAPSSPDKYALVMNCTDEEGVLVGENDWTVYVTNMQPVGLGADDLVTLTEENPFVSDANGQVTWEVPKNTEWLSIRIVRLMADGTTETQSETFEIDGTKADANDVINVADLLND